MEQIIRRRYSEDCQVPAVAFECWKTVLTRFRTSAWQKTIFDISACDNFPVSVLLATTPVLPSFRSDLE